MLCNAVRKLAKNFSDTVYNLAMSEESCMYTVGKCGPGVGCIVGQAFIEAYPHLEHVAKDTDNVGVAGPDRLASNAGLQVCPNDIKWLTIVQNKQDNGCEWGSAVEFADETLGLS